MDRSTTIPVVAGAGVLGDLSIRCGLASAPCSSLGWDDEAIVYAVDLGTTNIKVVRYDDARVQAAAPASMRYRRQRDHVVFDPASCSRP